MKRKLFELALFTLLGTVMFVSKFLLDFLPNIHMNTMLIIVFTLVFRQKALIPIYVFVFLTGIYAAFALWWIPYLYIWLFPFAITMLLPRKIPKKVAVPVYMAVCASHGFLYGTLYAPSQALLFGLDFKGMCAWIIAGLPWDAVHGISNCMLAILVLPLSIPLKKVYTDILKRI